MSKLSTFSIKSGLRMRPKPICEHASGSASWFPIDGQYLRKCNHAAAPAFTGGCIEDYRTKKVVCQHYTKPK